MANFNKAFNFRGGFQVDTDVLIVRGQNVGIGSTIPNERLVVNGTIQANGLNVLSSEAVELNTAQAGILTVTEVLNVGVLKPNPNAVEFPFAEPQVQIKTGIITSADPSVGVVTYYGDGAQLLNLPTSQWLDTDVGLGFTSIYAQGNVGVATDDPRYEFQVGGVPFDTTTGPFLAAQRGVAIDRGDVLVSGMVSTRGEFSGIGSLITVINADNIAIGSIGSMRYGSVINTEEVYADRFIGIADTAASVTFDAELVFNSGIVTNFQAEELIVTGISSVNIVKVKDHLQVGDEATPGNVGDLEVFKNSGASAYIYSLSDSGAANVFIGRERVSGANNEYGGIRKGFIPGVNITGAADLDLVNFDVGNVNYYLHAGSGGASATSGSFRWIYGQTNTIMGEFARDGKFTLNGNVDPDAVTLDVNGNVSTKSIAADGLVSAADGMYSAGITTFAGDTSFTASVTFDDINIEGDLNIDSLLIGSDPSTGGQGTLIGLTSAFIAGVARFEQGTITEFSTEIQTSLLRGDVDASTITFSNNITGPFGFSIDPQGDIATQGTITANGDVSSGGELSGATLAITGDGEFGGNLEMGSAEIAGNLLGNTGEFTTLTVGEINVTVSAGDIETDSIINTGTIDTDILNANNIYTDSIGGGTVSTPTTMTITSNLEGSNADVPNLGEVGVRVVEIAEYIIMGGKRLSFDFGDTTTPGIGTMKIQVSNLVTGVLEKEVSLDYNVDNN